MICRTLTGLVSSCFSSSAFRRPKRVRGPPRGLQRSEGSVQSALIPAFVQQWKQRTGERSTFEALSPHLAHTGPCYCRRSRCRHRRTVAESDLQQLGAAPVPSPTIGNRATARIVTTSLVALGVRKGIRKRYTVGKTWRDPALRCSIRVRKPPAAPCGISLRSGPGSGRHQAGIVEALYDSAGDLVARIQRNVKVMDKAVGSP